MARELPGPDDLLRRRDRDPILYVVAQTYTCPFCDPRPQGARTTVDWMGANTDGPSGRCRECGQKYQLAATGNPDFVPRAVFDTCACRHLRGDHRAGCRVCSCAGFAEGALE